MQQFETFGECLKRVLKEEKLSASEAARLVGFRSRNSMFRILSGETGYELKQRFVQSLQQALGNAWPQERWTQLQEALIKEHLGPQRYESHLAFRRMLYGLERDEAPYLVHLEGPEGQALIRPFRDVLCEVVRSERVEIVVTGCYDSALMALLAEMCGEAGAQGRLVLRQYIDAAEETISQHILGILPLVAKPWYNARLVNPGDCPAEMLAIYRASTIHLNRWDVQGRQHASTFLLYDKRDFILIDVCMRNSLYSCIIDKWRFQLELLKPMTAKTDGGPETFVEYTRQYGQLEEDCVILSIKPDVHFNCIPPSVLEPAIIEGFEQSGMAAGEELEALMGVLWSIHEGRFNNMLEKRKPTHLVYSLPMMERFMRTGVQSDQFFIQRAYTVEERRACIRVLLDAMRTHPYFNIHFLKEDMPAPRYEISYYEGKGVMLMDAYTNYALDDDHSQALIILPAFMEAFKRYFMEELLENHVLSRSETIRALERLLVMNVQE